MIYWEQFKSVLVHKWYVFSAGRLTGVPVWRLIIHDWSKFTPIEFINYSRWKYGIKSKEDWAEAWLHHLHYNPHHPEHWILSWNGNPNFYDGFGKPVAKFTTIRPMPEIFVREMIADFLATSRQVTGKWDIAAWINKDGPDRYYHDDTITLIDKVMKEIGYTLTDNCNWSWVSCGFVGLHLGDPCIYCNVGHDDVEVGPCPGPTVKSDEVSK